MAMMEVQPQEAHTQSPQTKRVKMGCCFSDTTPPVPMEIQPDPGYAPITIFSHKLGVFGRDYAIYNGTEYPNSSKDRQEKMWMWFNKSDGPVQNTGTIELENFVRKDEANPKKGQVLYSCTITERPHYEKFHRIANSSSMSFFGFSSSPTAAEDSFYLNHHRHRNSRNYSAEVMHPEMITKWRLTTKAVFKDGNIGRGAANFKGLEVFLYVNSSGTVATTWERTFHQVEEGDPPRRRMVEDIRKIETEFVDRVDFQLVYANQLWAQWSIDGDVQDNSGDVINSTPFFDLVRKGGWFVPSGFVITTKPPADPAFCALLAHVCATEYSVAEINNDLNAATPYLPPGGGFSWGPPQGMQMNYQPCTIQGDFQWQ